MLTSVNIKRILSLLMCLVLLAAVGLSAVPKTRTNPLGIPDDQYENIVEFLDTINPETGEPNGQQYCLGYGMAAYNESEEAKSDAINRFVLIFNYGDYSVVEGVKFYYPDYNDPNGCTTTIFVDLYGYLNLSGTGIGEFVAAPDGLTGINLADCDQLRMFDFVGADNCREILLSGCRASLKLSFTEQIHACSLFSLPVLFLHQELMFSATEYFKKSFMAIPASSTLKTTSSVCKQKHFQAASSAGMPTVNCTLPIISAEFPILNT